MICENLNLLTILRDLNFTKRLKMFSLFQFFLKLKSNGALTFDRYNTVEHGLPAICCYYVYQYFIANMH